MRYIPETADKLPTLTGVYIFKDKTGVVLYVGKAKDLKKRVSSYFQNKKLGAKTVNLVSQIASIETTLVGSEFEALLLEAKLVKRYLPKYNVVWKDDKHYIYVKITADIFPRILFSRREGEKGATYFGPFPSAHTVRELLAYLRSIFPYCTQNPKIKRNCFYTHLGLCNPCPTDIVKKTGDPYRQARSSYLGNIKQIKLLLKGRIIGVKTYLQGQMKGFAVKEKYEQAAVFRDRLNKLEYLLASYKSPQAYMENPQLFSQTLESGGAELRAILKNYFTALPPIRRIECYDVSNIAGKFATGSLVTFVSGLPEKDYYRRFRIKTVQKINDFAMLSEVMQRRFRHKDWPLPDLLVVDGGKPQLLALKRVLSNFDIKLPVIGLAKREEELVILDGDKSLKLKLPASSAALQLVQRLRDEAHRFAHKYHELLRLKYLIHN